MEQALDGSRVALDSHYIIHWSDFRCGAYRVPDKRLKQAAHEGVERLLELQMMDRLTVGISERFRTDKIHDSHANRKARHLDALEALLAKGVELLPTTFRFDVGWGAFATDEDRACEKKLLRILFPSGITPPLEGHWLNEINDVDHLRDALRARYGVFLTEDKAILKHAEAIVNLGIRISAISGFLDEFAIAPIEGTRRGHPIDASDDRARFKAGES